MFFNKRKSQPEQTIQPVPTQTPAPQDVTVEQIAQSPENNYVRTVTAFCEQFDLDPVSLNQAVQEPNQNPLATTTAKQFFILDAIAISKRDHLPSRLAIVELVKLYKKNNRQLLIDPNSSEIWAAVETYYALTHVGESEKPFNRRIIRIFKETRGEKLYYLTGINIDEAPESWLLTIADAVKHDLHAMNIPLNTVDNSEIKRAIESKDTSIWKWLGLVDYPYAPDEPDDPDNHTPSLLSVLNEYAINYDLKIETLIEIVGNEGQDMRDPVTAYQMFILDAIARAETKNIPPSDAIQQVADEYRQGTRFVPDLDDSAIAAKVKTYAAILYMTKQQSELDKLIIHLFSKTRSKVFKYLTGRDFDESDKLLDVFITRAVKNDLIATGVEPEDATEDDIRTVIISPNTTIWRWLGCDPNA